MIVARIGKKTTPRDNIDDELAIMGFVKTKQEIDILNEKLKEYKEQLATAAKEVLADDEASTVTLQYHDRAVKVTLGIDVKIKDEEKLREVLGERFYDLVSESIVQKPEKKLKDMALEDDGLLACLEIKEKAPSVVTAKAV